MNKISNSNNCIVCAEEYSNDELETVVLSKINTTNFKICQNCLNISDPAEDYKQAREIVKTYLNLTKTKQLFDEAKEILDSLKK